MYAFATVPSGTIQDIRAIAIEQKVGTDATAEEIYDSLEIHAPQTSHENIFAHREAPAAMEGERQRWFGMDKDFFNGLPTFPWSQIFNMTGAPLEEVMKIGKDAKKHVEWEVFNKKELLIDRIKARRGTAASTQ